MLRQFELVERVRSYDPDVDEEGLDRAYVFAVKMHGSQKRASGDPYFSHPVEVAGILTEYKLDYASIVTALLHDTIEDTAASYDDIKQMFGEEVAKLVEGVTKLSRIQLQSDQTKQAENFRKLLLAMSEDIRVLLVKLADRVHNMRTLQYHKKPEKRQRIARETMEIYAPLAERIGMQEMKNDEIEVDLKELFFVFWGKLWIILLSGIVLGIAAYFYTSVMITPQYASDGTVYILTRSNSNQQVTTGDLNMSAQLTSDFEELIISHTVLDEVIEQIDYEGLTFGSLKNKITVTNRTDTRILQITVTDPDPLMAKAIVDKVIEISSEKIKSIMDIEAVNLVDEGTLNSTPVSPSYKKNVLIGVLIGIVITSAIVIVMYLLDDKIHTGEDIEKYLGLSVLGVIPEVSNEKKKMRRKGVK